METLGGGMVLNPHTRRHKNATMQESLKNLGMLEKGKLEEVLEERNLAEPADRRPLPSSCADAASTRPIRP